MDVVPLLTPPAGVPSHIERLADEPIRTARRLGGLSLLG